MERRPAPERLTGWRPWTLDELAAVEPNGWRVASLFAGAGGSSMGWKLAGFKVVFAADIDAHQSAIYRRNDTSGTVVETVDVRTVDGAALVERFGPIDVLDGSPPCGDFSTAGKRTKAWGKAKVSTGRRSDDLFDEYVRVLSGVRPRVFVAENVAAFSGGTATGYARRVFAAMRDLGYRVEARLLDGCWLGVPQLRRRTIIVGVRDDLGLDPRFPTPFPDRPTIRDVVDPSVRALFKRNLGSHFDPDEPVRTARRASLDEPAQTVTAMYAGGSFTWPTSVVFAPPAESECDAPPVPERLREVWPGEDLRFYTLAEVRRLSTFPDDFVLLGSFTQRWHALGMSVPPFMMRAVAAQVAGILTDSEPHVSVPEPLPSAR